MKLKLSYCSNETSNKLHTFILLYESEVLIVTRLENVSKKFIIKKQMNIQFKIMYNVLYGALYVL